MINLTKEEMQKYVEEKLPTSKIIEAKKVGNTLAIQGKEGEEVITYSTDSEGNEVIERVQNVTLDSETGQPGWILTKVDENNNPVIDKNGHPNQYIVADSVFRKTYEPSKDGENLYSKSQIEKFIKLDEDLHFGTKYGDMTVMKGGYAKITDMSRISGISENDFNDTYVVVQPQVEEQITSEVVDKDVILQQVANGQAVIKGYESNPEQAFVDAEQEMNKRLNSFQNQPIREDELTPEQKEQAKREWIEEHTAAYIDENGNKVISETLNEKVDKIIQDMEQGKVDGNGAPLINNQSNEQLEQGQAYTKKGFTVPWILGLITGAISVGIILLGIMLK